MTLKSQSFGNWIKSQRKERGWTQVELGEQIGYAEITVRKLEANEYPPPVRLIESLFAIFQVAEQDQRRLKTLAQVIKRHANKPSQVSVISHTTLPMSPLKLIGRDDEFKRANELLSQPDCRLLSIIGLGGIGKTRLALKIGQQQQSLFRDGVQLISFVSLNSNDFMLSLWAETFGLRLNGYETIENQILKFLAHKNLLLILDSFENVLLPNTFLSILIQQAPEVKLLVTSRERLNLSQEWSLPLFGLKYPEIKSQDTLNFPAIKLFIDTARHIQSDFHVNEQETQAIIEICGALGGVPLGIEMAASWVGILSCRELADLVRHQVAMLEHRHYDIPDRHRTMRTIFEASWQQLTPNQQVILQICSLFKGGFTLEAATSVTNASPKTLANLQDKFLLLRDTTGRYQIHDMLYQFINSTLSDEDRQRYSVKHCAYFGKYVGYLNPQLQNNLTVSSIRGIATEIENIRQAWLWLCSKQFVEFFNQFWEPLFWYYDLTNSFEEGESMFGRAVQAFSEYQSKSESLEPLIFSKSVQTFLNWRLGDLQKAVQHMAELGTLIALNTEQMKNPLLRFYIYETEGFLAVAQGDIQRALLLSDHILAAVNEAGFNWYLLQAHILIGRIQEQAGNFEIATIHLDEALRINKIILNSWGLAYILTEKGSILESKRDLNGAYQLFSKCLSTYQEVYDTWGIIMSHVNLGRIARCRGYLQESANHHLEALQILGDSRQTWLMVDNLIEVAMLFYECEEIQRSLEILDFVLHHPACTLPYRNRAQSYRQEILTRHAESPLTFSNNLTFQTDIKALNTLIADQLAGM
ncbi:MAG: helix-turn-helix domain-containing protein [Anaerolineae bacterium]|nr:helix-turn-helix domain-containing protein [Anaerolineae bacterium]